MKRRSKVEAKKLHSIKGSGFKITKRTAQKTKERTVKKNEVSVEKRKQGKRQKGDPEQGRSLASLVEIKQGALEPKANTEKGLS